ncbi:MAG: hypothetical protein AAF283_13130 [Cyanobacteria bacterium P01_A01_bin.70]
MALDLIVVKLPGSSLETTERRSLGHLVNSSAAGLNLTKLTDVGV